ncbi:MAG: enoyl-CoA hydratase/isomerase family protein [Deltaproteobacteria bacterium]|nr:enoyl-CoA hydratase/isomerase family protein [Deltaproteobacteria bacterium]
MEFKAVIWEKRDGIGQITMNRADKMNAMSLDMLDEIESAQEKAMEDAEVRALIVTGQGRAYCQSLAMQTIDAKEGLLAIREKRKPNFSGQ